MTDTLEFDQTDKNSKQNTVTVNISASKTKPVWEWECSEALSKVNKKNENGPHGSHPLPIRQWNCQKFINIKKYKIVFEIRKDYLTIIFFLMAISDFFFKEVHKYARLRKQ